jgi:hypothetical protein
MHNSELAAVTQPAALSRDQMAHFLLELWRRYRLNDDKKCRKMWRMISTVFLYSRF